MYFFIFFSRLWRMEIPPLRYPLLPPPLLLLPSRDWPHLQWSLWRPSLGEEAVALGATVITATQQVISPTLPLAATATPPSSRRTRQRSSNRPKTPLAPLPPPQLLSPTPAPPPTATLPHWPPLHPMPAHRSSVLQIRSRRLHQGPRQPPTAWALAWASLWGKAFRAPSPPAPCPEASACRGCRHPWRAPWQAFCPVTPLHPTLRRSAPAYQALWVESAQQRPTVL